MKKLIAELSLLLISTITAYAQIPDKTIADMMTNRVLSNEDISYNAILMVPRLYHEHKTDTLNAVLGFWERNYPNDPMRVLFTMVHEIEQHTFRETMHVSETPRMKTITYNDSMEFYGYILNYLGWYEDMYDIDSVPNRYNYHKYQREAYATFFGLLQSIAEVQLRRQDLTPPEDFLLHYMTHPTLRAFVVLGDARYNGTMLQKAYTNYTDDRKTVSGLSWGLTAGWWSPTGNLSVLGNHPSICMIFGGRSPRWSFDLAFDIRLQHAPNQYVVIVDDSLFRTSHYVGYYGGFNVGYALLMKKRHEVDILGSMGIDAFNAFKSNGTDNSTNQTKGPTQTLLSFNMNAGIGYRYYLKKKVDNKMAHFTYIGIQARYNYNNYCNPGGTDLAGNAYTVSLIFGGYNKPLSTNTLRSRSHLR